MGIVISVDRQRMRCHNTNFVAGSQEFIEFNFELSSEWDGLLVYAQFTQDGVPYNLYLDSNNSVYLPPEIHKGVCTLALRGSKGNTIAVTEAIQLKISDNPIVANGQSTNITISLYEQLVNKVDELLEDDSVIKETTEKVLAGYLADGQFAALTISNGSIDIIKLNKNDIATPSEITEFLTNL